MKMQEYLLDGASFQSRAVLNMLCDICSLKDVELTSVTNGREGYIVSVQSYSREKVQYLQRNIYFANTRNSDGIIVVVFDESFFGQVNLMSSKVFEESYESKDKNRIRYFEHGKILESAIFISKGLENFVNDIVGFE